MKNHVQKMTCQPCYRQRSECPGRLPAQQRGQAQTQPSHQAGVRGRRTKKGPNSPLEKGRKSSASGKCRGRPWSALLRVVVTSWRGVAAESHVGAGHTAPAARWCNPFHPFRQSPLVGGDHLLPEAGGPALGG